MVFSVLPDIPVFLPKKKVENLEKKLFDKNGLIVDFIKWLPVQIRQL